MDPTRFGPIAMRRILNQEVVTDTPLLPCPDLFAHRETLRLSAPKVVERLVGIVGRKLTAHIGGVKDPRTVDGWAAGGRIYGDVEAGCGLFFRRPRLEGVRFARRCTSENILSLVTFIGSINPICVRLLDGAVVCPLGCRER